MARNEQVNIIRRIEVIEGGGHHGGAWKVAYADFMTAMMAFFLLMWILSSADEQKLRGVAEYFTNATMPGGSGVLDGATLGPPGILSASNGTVVARGSENGPVDDPSPAQWEVRDVTPTADPQQLVRGTTKGTNENPAAGDVAKAYNAETMADAEGERAGTGSGESNAAAQEALQKADQAQFDKLQAEIMQAMQENPDLRPLQKNVIFERTVEGLRIQLIDQEGKPMFSSGSPKMVKAAHILVENLGNSLTNLPNSLVITGHTDSVPFTSRKSYDNWDLSTDRANTTRRILAQSGVQPGRIVRVSGKADTELLVPEAPEDPTNRRITLLLQYRTAEVANAQADALPESTDQVNAIPPETPATEETQIASTETPAQKEPMQETVVEETPVNRLTMLNDKTFENLRNVLR
ncbi:MAG: chemotaxis protein MotB [Rhodobacteraceae bacterium]|nr:MAG: chemotaxis protein MotB [Paracoccaceae bacterium]